MVIKRSMTLCIKKIDAKVRLFMVKLVGEGEIIVMGILFKRMEIL